MIDTTSRTRLAGMAIAVALLGAACSGAGAPAATPTPAPTGTPAHTSTPSPAPTSVATTAATEGPSAAEPERTPGSGAIYDPDANPSADIAAALASASADGKPVLLDFGADWCPDCVVLARMFDSPAFAGYLDAVHVVRIDVGVWDHNLDVAAEYGSPINAGIPAVVLLSPEGKVLADTSDGRLASAASMTSEQVLTVLRSLGTP